MEYNKVFVYGTLRKGRIETILPSVAPFVRLVGKGFVKGKLYSVSEYPGAVVSGSGKVYGDIIEIQNGKREEVIELLDEYEEFDAKNKKTSLFIRDSAEAVTNKGQKIRTWIYWYNKEVKGLKLIKDGIYRSRKK